MSDLGTANCGCGCEGRDRFGGDCGCGGCNGGCGCGNNGCAAMAVDADARQHNISCIGLKRRSHFSVSFFIYIYNADPGRSHYGRKTFKTNDTI